MPTFRLTRTPDWSRELHTAADQFEAAVVEVAKTLDPEQFEVALAKLNAATQRMGREILALDRKRRPEMHKR